MDIDLLQVSEESCDVFSDVLKVFDVVNYNYFNDILTQNLEREKSRVTKTFSAKYKE